jgi:hypothetical protein
MQIRMTASYETEIVTLRGEKKNLEPQRTRRNTGEKHKISPRKRGGAERLQKINLTADPLMTLIYTDQEFK